MTQFLEGILTFLQSIGALIGNLLSGITQLLWMIPVGVSTLTYSIGTMPTVIVGFAAALISISVVYLIIGR